MRRSHHYHDYHAQADRARRLADVTIQQNVAEILRRVADELDHLAEDVTADEARTLLHAAELAKAPDDQRRKRH
jgi:hypothetical protein